MCSRQTVNCKRQTLQLSQTSSCVKRKSSNINLLVSVVKQQGVCERHFQSFRWNTWQSITPNLCPIYTHEIYKNIFNQNIKVNYTKPSRLNEFLARIPSHCIFSQKTTCSCHVIIWYGGCQPHQGLTCTEWWLCFNRKQGILG